MTAARALEFVANLARDARRLAVHFLRQRLQPVVSLRDGRGTEGVSLDNVRPGLQVLAVNIGDQLRLRQRENVIVTLEVPLGISQSRATELLLAQLVALNHGAHRTIQHEDPLGQRRY